MALCFGIGSRWGMQALVAEQAASSLKNFF